MKRRLVIIGNGMAATRLAETLVARGRQISDSDYR
jgi:nitrite reductase (NADH) large subunit